MVTDCPFCNMWRIPADRPVSWREPRYNIATFTPLNPVTPGHLLFVPRLHTADAAESPMLTGMVFEAAALWGSVHEEEFNLIVNNGPTATQSVFHLHVHYVPRKKDDGLALPWYSGKGNHQ